MNYGLYLSAGGALVNSHRQDVLANNLANINTVGFKPDLASVVARQPESSDPSAPLGTAQQLLDKLGGGVFAGATRTAFTPGGLQQTGRDLDAALTDRNSFFAVSVTDPATGQAGVRLTRDGRFGVNREGQLVTASGHPVLGPDDLPINVAPGVPVQLTEGGQLRQLGNTVGQIQVATVTDLPALEKAGENLFAYTGPDPRTLNEQPEIRTGAVEGSATNGIATMMQIMAATKAATGNVRLIEYHDRMMDRAINTLGAVA